MVQTSYDLPVVQKAIYNVNNVYMVSKCVNFAKLKSCLILHSHALKWYLIFTHLLLWVSFFEHQTFMYTHISFSSRSRVMYFRWIHSTTANPIQHSNKVLWLLYVGINSMRYFSYKYWYNFLWEGKIVSLFQEPVRTCQSLSVRTAQTSVLV